MFSRYDGVLNRSANDIDTMRPEERVRLRFLLIKAPPSLWRRSRQSRQRASWTVSFLNSSLLELDIHNPGQLGSIQVSY